jgi:outer membrane lipoprotein SlyB
MKAALALSLAAAFLAGCANDMTRSTDARDVPTVHQMPYYAGTGVVTSWAPSPSAGAGGSGRPMGELLRMEVKMDDGRTQYIDTESRDFPIGTRVRLSENREITRY